jgi:biopolymer transport protein ExbD
MSLRRKKVKENFSLDMTTCSDIIFTLLLFYILSQNFLPQTSLELPETVSSEQADTHEQIKIEIEESGKILWNEEVYEEENLVKKVVEASLKQDNTSIMIFAHKKSPAGICIELLDKLRNAGIKNVIFAGAPPKKAEIKNEQ